MKKYNLWFYTHVSKPTTEEFCKLIEDRWEDKVEIIGIKSILIKFLGIDSLTIEDLLYPDSFLKNLQKFMMFIKIMKC